MSFMAPMGLISDLWLLCLSLFFCTTITPPIWVDERVEWLSSLCVRVCVDIKVSLHALLGNLSIPCFILPCISIDKLPRLLASRPMILTNFLKIWLSCSPPVRWRFISFFLGLSNFVSLRVWSKSCQLLIGGWPCGSCLHGISLWIAGPNVCIAGWPLICRVWSNLKIQRILRPGSLGWSASSTRILLLTEISCLV